MGINSRAGIHALLRLVQKRWPPEQSAAIRAEALCRLVCNEYREWLHVQRGLAKASIRVWEGRYFLSWYTSRSPGRPKTEVREVFIRTRAPYRPLSGLYSEIRRRLGLPV
jgi:hypothetical protein